jgi:beta-N-acetylhexosaminidase
MKIDLDTKIGQLLMIGFRGLTISADAPIARDIRAGRIGGVVLFDYDVLTADHIRNIQAPAQLQALIASLQALAPTPLLVSADQEGGIISRLKEQYGFPATQSEQALGAQNDVEKTRAAAVAEAKVLAAMGINLNLAPVVDVNTNPNNPIIAKYERAFSPDPQVVTNNASAEIQGYHSQGILCTLKHFPGHGSSTADSHQGFVDVTDTWNELELIPYRNIIGAGLADAIMTAHIFNANLDSNVPATLSKPIITGILRDQLKYDGVVISDDMQMGAIALYYGYEQAALLALQAGVDVLAIANQLQYDPDIASKTIAIIKQHLNARRLSPARIDEAYARVMKLKQRLGKAQ